MIQAKRDDGTYPKVFELLTVLITFGSFVPVTLKLCSADQITKDKYLFKAKLYNTLVSEAKILNTKNNSNELDMVKVKIKESRKISIPYTFTAAKTTNKSKKL